MIPLKLSELAEVLGCEMPNRDAKVESVVTDSRKVHYGALFAALPGSQVDGHDFAPSAVNLGATALLVEHRLDLDIPQLVVPDVLRALGQVARLVRDRLDPIVIGITGSNGKTSVKEMLASILRQNAQVLATVGNFNNELGVPLSLFELKPFHRYAVLEMGASRAGDIAYLCSIGRPDLGIVNNVGPAHLQGFGDEAGVAKAKGEMFSSLSEEGWAIINGDQPWLPLWREMNTAGNVLTFGTRSDNDVFVESEGGNSFMVTPQGRFEIRLSLPGEHNLMNAAAATAAALGLGIGLQDIQQGLEKVKPVPGRLNLMRTSAGWTIIDDTYNANPASLYSALQVLANLQGTAWLVLGDMKELGENSRKLHAEVGDAARLMGVSRIFAIGEMSEYTVDSFGEGATHYPDRDALIQAVCAELRPGINCLVKGSRSMGMEAVVEAITEGQKMREAG
jgi:UDP-N-acetylmuramoyl-tripeptide--D-alanyl-D-alanine ligase